MSVNHIRDIEKVMRSRERGRLFVQLYAAAKQLSDSYPGRFPYLQFNVKEIEERGLAPKLDRGK